MGRDGSRRRWTGWVGFCLSLSLAGTHAAPTLPATLAVVQRMPQSNQQAFAQLALDHLIDRFRTELRHAPGKAAGWQRGTGGYLAQLEGLRAELDAGASVRFLGGPRGSFRLLVGSRQVMLQTPREAVQGAFERALVDDWCAMTDCGNPQARPTTIAIAEPQRVAAEPDSSAPDEDVRPAGSPGLARAAEVPGKAQGSPAATPKVALTPGVAPSETLDQRTSSAKSAASSMPSGTGEVLEAVAFAKPAALPEELVPTPQAVAPPRETIRLVASTPAFPRMDARAPDAKVPAAMPRPGTWQFADATGPTFASEDGLQCVYGDTRHLKLKQASCTAVMQDLRQVVAGLRALTARGGSIDWGALRLEPRGLGKPAHFSVGATSKGFDVETPHLVAAPELLGLLTPWLQARVRGQTQVGQIELPEQLNYLEANLR